MRTGISRAKNQAAAALGWITMFPFPLAVTAAPGGGVGVGGGGGTRESPPHAASDRANATPSTYERARLRFVHGLLLVLSYARPRERLDQIRATG